MSDGSSFQMNPIFRMLSGVLSIAVIYVAGQLLFGIGDYYFRILMICGISIILAVSLNIVNGFTGQFSLGHAGFMAVGAYTSSALTHYKGQSILDYLMKIGIPENISSFLLLMCAIILGMALSAIMGVLVALPSFRLRGDYLAIVTLGFSEVVRIVLLNIDAVGGPRGLRDIPILTNFTWVFTIAIGTIILSRNIALSCHGRALFAIREDEIAAQCLGVNITRYKVLAFVISATLAGAAGVLFAHYDGYINPSGFGFMKSIEIVAMVVLGGMGSISGAVIAAISLTTLPELLRSAAQYRMVLYSILLIGLMLRRPQGIFGRKEIGWPHIKIKSGKDKQVAS